MNAIILGVNSDIARHISAGLILDGWTVFGSARSSIDFSDNESIDKGVSLLSMPWDLVLCAVGNLMPIGKFSAIHPLDWAKAVQINALGPLRMLHHLLPFRKENASAVFFSGTNPHKANPGYSAYSAAKALLSRAVQEIDSEIDTKVFSLAPGFTVTKIHAVHDVKARGEGTNLEDIFSCLKHCISRPKSEVGGKTIFVPQWAAVWRELA